MKRPLNLESELSNVINLFKKLPITDSSEQEELIDLDLDLLICEIDKIDIRTERTINSEEEFDKFIKNYDKLKEFKDIENNSPAFKKSFDLFMEKLDSINQYYLKNISFDLNTYSDQNEYNMYDISTVQEIVKRSEELLLKSLNVNDSKLKLNLILEAYSNFILIIEDYNYEDYHKNKKVKKVFH